MPDFGRFVVDTNPVEEISSHVVSSISSVNVTSGV